MVSVLMKRLAIAAVAGAVMVSASGCSLVSSGKRIIRVSHAQSETHPEHLGMLAFKEYVEERLGDKYEVQIFPNEILGSAQKAIELTQTGAIDLLLRVRQIWRHLRMSMRFSACPIFLTPKKSTGL